jgi:hypothetical protein
MMLRSVSDVYLSVHSLLVVSTGSDLFSGPEHPQAHSLYTPSDLSMSDGANPLTLLPCEFCHVHSLVRMAGLTDIRGI